MRTSLVQVLASICMFMLAPALTSVVRETALIESLEGKRENLVPDRLIRRLKVFGKADLD